MLNQTDSAVQCSGHGEVTRDIQTETVFDQAHEFARHPWLAHLPQPDCGQPEVGHHAGRHPIWQNAPQPHLPWDVTLAKQKQTRGWTIQIAYYGSERI